MRYKYKLLNLRSIKDFERAERFQANGWKVLYVGFNNVLLEKEVE